MNFTCKACDCPLPTVSASGWPNWRLTFDYIWPKVSNERAEDGHKFYRFYLCTVRYLACTQTLLTASSFNVA